MIYSNFTHLVHELLLCVLYVHLSLSLCFHLHIHCCEMLWPILKTFVQKIFVLYITMNIPTCFGLQGIIIVESNQISTELC
jgi:hypothetical protein